MLIVRGQISTLGQASPAQIVTTVWGTNPVAGSTVLIFAEVNAAGNTITVTDNGTSPSTFTLDATTTAGKGAHIFRANGISLPSAGAYTVTLQQTGTAGTMQAGGIAYTGVQDGAPEATNTGGATGTAVTTNAVTGSPGDLYFSAFSDGSGLNPETITHTGADFTEQFRVTNGSSWWPCASSDAIVSAGGSEADTWTLGDSVAWGAVIACYKAAPDSGAALTFWDNH